MEEKNVIEPIRETLKACLDALREFGAPFMLIGGVARAFLAKPRATTDVDASVFLDDDERIGDLLAVFERHGIKSPYKNAIEFARHNRLLRLTDKYGIGIDVALVVTPFEMSALQKVTELTLQNDNIVAPIPRPEDFIVMKAVANRLEDHADIDEVLQMHEGIDVRHVRKWVQLHALALESPDIIENLERILKKHGYPKAGKKIRRKK